MNKKTLYNIFIWTFIVLYACTALISCIHAVDFFSIGNVSWMSIMLACVFELGQATVLASLLLSDNKNKIMPWVLMVILTTVQVIGNVYSCFKFISLSEINYYQYLQKPLLFWINGISEETVSRQEDLSVRKSHGQDGVREERRPDRRGTSRRGRDQFLHQLPLQGSMQALRPGAGRTALCGDPSRL